MTSVNRYVIIDLIKDSTERRRTGYYMTIYGRFNKDNKTLEIKSDGSYSLGIWEAIYNAETANEAWKLFKAHKTGEILPRWTSSIKWEGTY